MGKTSTSTFCPIECSTFCPGEVWYLDVLPSLSTCRRLSTFCPARYLSIYIYILGCLVHEIWPHLLLLRILVELMYYVTHCASMWSHLLTDFQNSFFGVHFFVVTKLCFFFHKSVHKFVRSNLTFLLIKQCTSMCMCRSKELIVFWVFLYFKNYLGVFFLY